MPTPPLFLRRFPWAFPLAIALTLAGCVDNDAPPETAKKAIPFDQVPKVARDAAAKHAPGVNFAEAWQNIGPGGKLHSYEIRGKVPADGKIREVRVSATGEVLESE